MQIKKLIQNVIQKLKDQFRQETGDEMRERINRANREYNARGIASIKFYDGAWDKGA